jgi:hypothetical protein
VTGVTVEAEALDEDPSLAAGEEGSAVDAAVVVVSLEVVVVAVLARFADAVCAVAESERVACSRVAVRLLAAVWAVVRTSASVAVALVVLAVPRLPSANTVAHMQTSSTSDTAATRRRSTFVRRTLARRMRAASGDRGGVRGESLAGMRAVSGRRLCTRLAEPENPLGSGFAPARRL